MAMKRILALVLVLTSILAPMGHPAARAAAPSWQSVAGPSGGSVAALAMSPGYVNDHTVFAGLRGRGVYRTLDGGFSWQSAGLPDQVVIDLAISPAFAADRTIFAAVGLPTTGFNVYRSTDGGATWQPPFVTPDPNNFQSIIGLSISPKTPWAIAGVNSWDDSPYRPPTMRGAVLNGAMPPASASLTAVTTST